MPTKLTINFVTTWNIRCGIASYSAFLASELKKILKVRIVEVPETRKFDVAYLLALGVKASSSCDLVHVQFEYGTFGIGAFPFYFGLMLRKVPIVTTFHEVLRKTEAELIGKYHLLLTKFICSVSDFLIVHNFKSKKLLTKICPSYGAKVNVIPHGCYENPLILNKDACKAKLGLTGKKVITIPGFVRRSKGHEVVIDLVPLLNKEIYLLIAGGARVREHEAYYEELKQRVEQQNISDRVTFYGYVPDEKIPVVMNATDIAILPHRCGVTQSGILHVLIAYRIPTIASNLAAFKEVASQYGCIELFRTEDKQDLFTKVSSLLQDESKQSLLKKKCEEMWSDTKWSLIAAKHMEVYLKVVESSNR